MTAQQSTATRPPNDGPCFQCGSSRTACEARSNLPLGCCPACRAIPTGGAHARRPPWTQNPADATAPPGADAAQDRQVEDLDHRHRALVILHRAYRPGDDWPDLLDRLSPDDIASLRGLFPHLPQQAARHFAERFIIPGGPA